MVACKKKGGDMKKTHQLAAIMAASFIVLSVSNNADAVSQWARKYSMNCQSCHTSFPRLNYFGEQFVRNGYQIPDTEDGDEGGKDKINDDTYIDKIGNLFGIRISVSPVEAKTNTLT